MRERLSENGVMTSVRERRTTSERNNVRETTSERDNECE